MTVFHPGHDSYHGFTMLLLTNGPRTYVGRWDAVEGDVIWLNDAEVHADGDGGVSKADFLDRLAHLGPMATIRRLAVPANDVVLAQQLGEWKRSRGR